MPPIRQLDPALVNQIAAGEVIERPASVVKELVENAIDAGATRIDIAVEHGGARLIRVTDNGGGIPRDDLPLAISPHATSKLATADDLFRIATLGFRGEALASIGAVSRLTLRSRPPEQEEGWEIGPAGHQGSRDQGTEGSRAETTASRAVLGPGRPAEGGHERTDASRDAEPRPAAAPVGTSVEVRNLFFNLPARRKFLRHASTELAHVTEQLARLALAHPEVAFTASHNDRQVRNLPVTGDRRTRIADFYGPELADCLLAVDRRERGLRIEALIAPPAHSKASTKWQYVFLNGRYIADRRIGFAVREAFRGLIENGRFPAVFIFLTTAPDAFDVNVHPTKIEVRWRDAGLVQSQVLAAVRETLLGHDLTPALRTPVADPTATSVDTEHHRRTRQALADYLKSIDPTQTRLGFEPPRFPSRNVRPTLATTYAETPGRHPDTRPPMASATDSGRADHARVDDAPETDPPCPPDAAAPSPPPNAIQIHNTYLVAQTDEGMLIIDQHALHERILYEKFRTRILAGPLESQRLLIPESIGVSPAQRQAVDRHTVALARLGIELEPFGPRSVAVQAFPVLLSDVNIKTFVSDLLDRLVETAGAETDETILHKALDMMACKAAVKAGDVLSTDEIQALLAQRHLVEKSSNCPHGRPTTLQLSTRDLERQFKRS